MKKSKIIVSVIMCALVAIGVVNICSIKSKASTTPAVDVVTGVDVTIEVPHGKVQLENATVKQYDGVIEYICGSFRCEVSNGILTIYNEEGVSHVMNEFNITYDENATW